MTAFEQMLVLLLLTTVLSVMARWLPWPRPITYVLGGVAVALVPGVPRVALDPGIFFLCFLPPLLFADGWLMPLREFVQALRPILLLATGLVVLTTLVVGWVAHALIPGLPLAMAFALGAVISPTDAVAVGAITDKLRIPTRLTTILNGESLMNDATGLVAFKFALAAAMAGTFSLRAATLDFALLAGGGLALGWLVAFGVGRLRDLLIRTHNADPLIEITLSLLTPYAAYLAAGPLGVSGILAVVAAGLYSGWRDPVKMDAETRQTTWIVWATALFWLNGLAFVLLGLQFPALLAAVAGRYSALELAIFVAVVAGAAMAIRLLWFFPAAYLPLAVSRRIRTTEPRPAWQELLVGGWAGLRGTVTLAAALSIPLTLADGTPFPARDLVIFLSFGVVVATLLLQGTTDGVADPPARIAGGRPAADGGASGAHDGDPRGPEGAACARVAGQFGGDERGAEPRARRIRRATLRTRGGRRDARPFPRAACRRDGVSLPGAGGGAAGDRRSLAPRRHLGRRAPSAAATARSRGRHVARPGRSGGVSAARRIGSRPLVPRGACERSFDALAGGAEARVEA